MDKTKKRVIAKKEVIAERVKERKLVKFYPVPEFKMNGKEITGFKVKMASLDDQLKARDLSEAPNRLVIRLLKMIKENQENISELDLGEFRKQLYYDDMHPKTIQTCEIFQRCVMEPSFEINEVFELSETHPDLVNNVAAFALGVEEKK